MRLVRFRFGDRIATGASEFESNTIRVLKGTFFEDPLPTGEEVPFDDVRLLAPVLPSKVVCVGKNYAAHAAEFGMQVPEEPLVFLKPSTAVIGPRDPIRLLPISRRVDYEGELAVVIGRIARNVRTRRSSTSSATRAGTTSRSETCRRPTTSGPARRGSTGRARSGPGSRPTSTPTTSGSRPG